VTTYRELAEAFPDHYRGDLATSLTNLRVRFSALGRPAAAEEAKREAAQLSQDREAVQ
jgi:hypothetical protein